MVTWNSDAERMLLLMVLKQNPSVKFDAAEAVRDWPDGDSPTQRGAADRFRAIRRQALALPMVAGSGNGTGTPSASALKTPRKTATPRRVSGGTASRMASTSYSTTNVNGNGSDGSRAPTSASKGSTSKASLTPATPVRSGDVSGAASGDGMPAAPFTVNKFKSALPNMNDDSDGEVETSSVTLNPSSGSTHVSGVKIKEEPGTHTLSFDGSPICDLKGNEGGKVNGKVRGNVNKFTNKSSLNGNRKRKSNKISRSSDEEEPTMFPTSSMASSREAFDHDEDEDEVDDEHGIAALTNTNMMATPSRRSLPRRSKSATPAKYTAHVDGDGDDDDDGEEQDAGVREDSEEDGEWAMDTEEDGWKGGWKGKGKIGWRQRVRLRREGWKRSEEVEDYGDEDEDED